MSKRRRRETRERLVGRDAARRLNRMVETLQEESREHRRSNPGTVFRKAEPEPEPETFEPPEIRTIPAGEIRRESERLRSEPGSRSGPGSETIDQPGGEPAAIRAETGGPKYPDVRVTLVGEDGNAFSILARVRRALRQADVPPAEVESFMSEATSGDYDALLRTVLRWVEVD